MLTCLVLMKQILDKDKIYGIQNMENFNFAFMLLNAYIQMMFIWQVSNQKYYKRGRKKGVVTPSHVQLEM